MSEVDPLLPAASKKELIKEMTGLSLKCVKDKVKHIQKRAISNLQNEGECSPFAPEEESSYFKSAFGKYIKDKKVPQAIKKILAKNLSKDDVSMFNHVYIDYVKAKK